MADGRVRIAAQPGGTCLIWLPAVAYIDTQAGPVEVGLDDEVARQLWERLGEHLGAETRTEWGARFEDGLVAERSTREAAELAVRSINGRHGDGQLVTRQVVTTPWTDAEEA
jgi:hypothetical protein